MEKVNTASSSGNDKTHPIHLRTPIETEVEPKVTKKWVPKEPIIIFKPLTDNPGGTIQST